MRYSVQREEILKFMDGNRSHPTAYEVHDALKEKIEKISLGTIYRNLNYLADKGLIKKISVTNETHYDSTLDDHYHLECNGCNKIFDVETDVSVSTSNSEHLIKKVNVLFEGVCSDCQKRKKEKL